MDIAKQIEVAQRKVDAIDKRIDAVRAEMYRSASIDPDALDYDTPEGEMVARMVAHNVRRDRPGFDGIERSLFLRRADAVDVRNNLVAKQARDDERRANREYSKANRSVCPTCGQQRLAA